MSALLFVMAAMLFLFIMFAFRFFSRVVRALPSLVLCQAGALLLVLSSELRFLLLACELLLQIYVLLLPL